MGNDNKNLKKTDQSTLDGNRWKTTVGFPDPSTYYKAGSVKLSPSDSANLKSVSELSKLIYERYSVVYNEMSILPRAKEFAANDQVENIQVNLYFPRNDREKSFVIETIGELLVVEQPVN